MTHPCSQVPTRITVLGFDGQITGRSSNYMIKKGDEGEELQPLRPPKGSSQDSPQPAGPGAELRVLRQPGEAEKEVVVGQPPAPQAIQPREQAAGGLHTSLALTPAGVCCQLHPALGLPPQPQPSSWSSALD